MKVAINESGVTLVEVLAAMAILSIILISIINIFPQMGMMNKQNEDKAQAINTAKELLLVWQNDSEVKTYIANPSTTILLSIDPPQIEGGYFIFKTTYNDFIGRIKIKETPSKTSELSNAHLIIVQLLNERNNVVSETYGYILI